MPPFFVLGTPRSATFWLSELLSTVERPCLHEPSRRWRDPADVAAFARSPGAAAADSMLTLRWREILAAVPNARILVVRRPVDEVLGSFEGIGLWHARLPALVERIDAEAVELLRSGAAMGESYRRIGDREFAQAAMWWLAGHALTDEHWTTWGPPYRPQTDIECAIEEAVDNAAGVRRVYPELVELGR